LEASHFYTTEFSCVDDIGLVTLGTLEVKVILKLDAGWGSKITYTDSFLKSSFFERRVSVSIK